jgi:hypothetical protein
MLPTDISILSEFVHPVSNGVSREAVNDEIVGDHDP